MQGGEPWKSGLVFQPAESLFFHGRRKAAVGEQGDAGIAMKRVNSQDMHGFLCRALGRPIGSSETGQQSWQRAGACRRDGPCHLMAFDTRGLVPGVDDSAADTVRPATAGRRISSRLISTRSRYQNACMK